MCVPHGNPKIVYLHNNIPSDSARHQGTPATYHCRPSRPQDILTNGHLSSTLQISTRTMEEAITKKSNFHGTNIDTIKASHTQFNNQADQVLPHNATTTNDDGDNQSLYPRDSVGPVFTPPSPVNDDFQKAMRRSEIQKDLKPLGLPNPKLLLCYRNAVLTMLINSDAFISYARWH